MSDQVSVNTDGLLNANGQLGEAAEQASAVYTSLLAKLQALGQPWGDDEAGQAFEGQYGGPAEQLLTGMSSLGNVLSSAVEGVYTMAKGYAATEEENTSSINLGGDSGDDPASSGRSELVDR